MSLGQPRDLFEERQQEGRMSRISGNITLLMAFFILLSAMPSSYATPPSTPITLSVSLSRAPGLNESADLTVTVTSVLDAPGTSVELIVPSGVTATPANWTTDLVANLPVTFSSSVSFQTSGNLTISARALRSAGPGTVWGDMKSIALTINPPALVPSLFGWKVSEVPVATLVTPGNATIVSSAPTPFTFPTNADQAPSVQTSVEPSRTPTVAPSASPPAGNVTLTGTWLFDDRPAPFGTGLQLGIDQQVIEIRHGDGTALASRVFCYTDTGGAYSCTFPDPGTTMRVWVRSWTNFNITGGSNRLGVFSGIEVTGGCGSDSIDCTYPVQTPAVSCAGGSTCSVGTWVVSAGGGEPYIGAHRMTHDLIESWKQIFFDVKHGTGVTAGPGRITYPVPSGHGTHAHVPPGDGWISIEPPSQNSASPVTHEFGHVVMANLWNTFTPNWPTSDCPSSHFINAVSGLGCALSEGWADFWMWYSLNDPVYRFPSGATTNMETRDNRTFSSGDQVEGNIAAVMGDLYDSHNDGPVTGPADRVSDGIQHVWHTISQQGYLNLAGWWSEYQALGHPACPALDIVLWNSISYSVPGCFRGTTPTHDFNGNFRSDVLWRDTGGNVAMWLMNGGAIASNLIAGNVPNNWTIRGSGDFDADGKSDILWRENGGDVVMWFMNGATRASFADFGTVSNVWTIVGTGDFNGDGTSDVLWRDTSGNVAMWLMNGGAIASNITVGNVPNNWTIYGTGDFDADGKSDIVWRENGGEVVIWFMNGGTRTSFADFGAVSNVWTIVGTGDFNGDGRSDILWRDTVGDVAMWLMNGGAIASNLTVGNVPTNWAIAETGDFSGTGKRGILWRNTTTGETVIWFMNGATMTSFADFGNVPTVWTIQGANAN
jgi:FG-GAP-like repeat